jgi:hypothetical protein
MQRSHCGESFSGSFQFRLPTRRGKNIKWEKHRAQKILSVVLQHSSTSEGLGALVAANLLTCERHKAPLGSDL